MDPYLISSYIDVTKIMLEMTILSNATGFPIDINGTNDPHANVKDLVRAFELERNGGILKILL